MREPWLPGESPPFLRGHRFRTVLAVKGSLRRAHTTRPGRLRAVLGREFK